MKAKDILKRSLIVVVTILTIVLVALAVCLEFSVEWMFDTWNHLTMSELVYHIKAPLDGTNEEMIVEYLDLCLVPTLLCVMAWLVLLAAFRGKKKRIIMAIGMVVSGIAIVMSVGKAWTTLEVSAYIQAQKETSDFIKEYYVAPDSVEITFPQEKRNLIYIFLESMETTYAEEENGGAFEESVIPELVSLAQNNENFSGQGGQQINGGYALTGTTWTMGAMFAHTSGLPLQISIDGNSMDTQEKFFPSIMTLGDILEKEEYSQTLLIGSDAVFGGRELYFAQHGDYDIKDYNYAAEQGWIPEEYRVFWGYEDKRLFEFAKEQLEELSQAEEPFNLTMLTVDTHFEDGYVCEECPDTFGDQYSDVMKCSSQRVAEFIEWVQQQPFYENTTIVIAGDHPTMDSDFCKDVDERVYDRRVYTAVINAPVEVEQNIWREYSTFDLFPTTIAALGTSIEGNRLGLGTNLFSSQQTLLEKFERDYIEVELMKKSAFMEEAASIEEVPSVEIDIKKGNVLNNTLSMYITNVKAVSDEAVNIVAAVWTESDQSDLVWIQAMSDGKDQYRVDIDKQQFSHKDGAYVIHIYAINSEGEQYMIGDAVVEIR